MAGTSPQFLLDTDDGRLFFDANGALSGGLRRLADFSGGVPNGGDIVLIG